VRSLSEAAHWTYLPAWSAATATAAWLAWRPGLHLAALSLIAWLLPLGYFVLDHHAHWIPIVLGAAVLLAAAAAGRAIDARLPASAALFAYGLIVAFAGLTIVQFIDPLVRHGHLAEAWNWRLVVLALITLALVLGAMLWALGSDNRPALWIGYTAFAVEVFTLYIQTFGSLFNTSLFFLVAAILVSLLAWAAYGLHRRKTATTGAPA